MYFINYPLCCTTLYCKMHSEISFATVGFYQQQMDVIENVV
jgi:hypothetical protein